MINKSSLKVILESHTAKITVMTKVLNPIAMGLYER